MNERAQGISVNVIIIAAIALVVMVILIALVINQGGNVNRNANTCETLSGADCQPEGQCPQGSAAAGIRSCPNEGDVCCIPLG